MKIEKNTVASVTYNLESEGEFIEKTDKENPLTFVVGVGMMIPGFEQQLLGKQEGDSYDITVTPEEAYGQKDPQAVVDLPKDVFVVDGVLQEELLEEGRVIPMQGKDGQPLHGTVMEVGDEKVKMDFNHQLAEKTLHFTGEIVNVREATPEELEHRHVHGPEGHQH